MQSEFGPARTIAVDLRAASPLASADLPDDGGLSGWRVLRNRIIPWRERLQVPGIVETLVADTLKRFVRRRTGRRPLILPVVREV